MPDRLTEERVAMNDATFRVANEKISETASDLGLTERPVPFICECADTRCSEIVPLRLEEYQRVRSDPTWFLNVPGHEAAALGAAVAVEQHDGYVIVAKQGHAAEVVEQLADGGSFVGSGG